MDTLHQQEASTLDKNDRKIYEELYSLYEIMGDAVKRIQKEGGTNAQLAYDIQLMIKKYMDDLVMGRYDLEEKYFVSLKEMVQHWKGNS